jgi:hypothetical protein
MEIIELLAKFVKNKSFIENVTTCCKEIERFSDLSEDWDGYGALPIGSMVTHNTILSLSIILNFSSISEITPISNGTIGLECKKNDKVAYLEIGNTKMSFYLTQPNKEPIYIYSDVEDIFLTSIRIGILISTLIDGE